MNDSKAIKIPCVYAEGRNMKKLHTYKLIKIEAKCRGLMWELSVCAYQDSE